MTTLMVPPPAAPAFEGEAGAGRVCEFGLCREPAQYLIVPELVALAGGSDGLATCGLHVTPAVSWGIADPGMPEIRDIRERRWGPAPR